MYPEPISKQIIDFKIKQVGTYGTQWRRPYEVCVDPNTVMDVIDAMGDAAKGDFMDAELEKVAAELIGLSAQPVAVSPPFGENVEMCSFLITVEHVFLLETIVEYIQGYVAREAIKEDFSIDPNARFFVNTVVRTRRALMARTPDGQQHKISSVVTATELLSNDNASTNLNENPVLFRPVDVFSMAGAQHLYDMANIVDTRNMLSAKAAISKIAANIPSHFLAMCLSSYKEAIIATEGQSSDSTLGMAASYVRGFPYNSSLFLTQIRKAEGGALIEKYFTLKSLVKADPQINEKITIHLRNSMPKEKKATADLQMFTAEARTVAELSVIVAALMRIGGFSRLSFMASGFHNGGDVELQVSQLTSLMEELSGEAVEDLRTKLIAQIRDYVIGEDAFPFTMEVVADVMGDFEIRIALDDPEASKIYTVPMFFDSLLSPMIVDRASDARENAVSLIDVISQVSGDPRFFEDFRF